MYIYIYIFTYREDHMYINTHRCVCMLMHKHVLDVCMHVSHRHYFRQPLYAFFPSSYCNMIGVFQSLCFYPSDARSLQFNCRDRFVSKLESLESCVRAYPALHFYCCGDQCLLHLKRVPISGPLPCAIHCKSCFDRVKLPAITGL